MTKNSSQEGSPVSFLLKIISFLVTPLHYTDNSWPIFLILTLGGRCEELIAVSRVRLSVPSVFWCQLMFVPWRGPSPDWPSSPSPCGLWSQVLLPLLLPRDRSSAQLGLRHQQSCGGRARHDTPCHHLNLQCQPESPCHNSLPPPPYIIIIITIITFIIITIIINSPVSGRPNSWEPPDID